MFPEIGPKAGYAVTVRYGMPDARFERLDFGDVLRAIDASPKPVIVVMEQALPEHIKNKNGLSGGNMTTAMKRLGCVGVVSDGPSRDMHEIRDMDFPMPADRRVRRLQRFRSARSSDAGVGLRHERSARRNHSHG